MSELVKKLRDLGDHASYEPHMHHVAADRIEALTERLAASFDLERAHIAVRKDARTQANYIKALESALKDVSKHIWRGDFHQLDQSTRDTLDYVLGTQDESQ